jgi:hypothetical protein
MRNVCEDQEIYKYAFVFKEEAIGAFENDKLFLIQAPPGTDIQVGTPTVHAEEVKYHLRAKSHSGPAIVSSVNEDLSQSVDHRRHPKMKRPKTEFDKIGEVPSNLLENEDDDENQNREQGIVDEMFEPTESLRVLSPPPSEMDYTLGQTRGETLSELFEDDIY